MSELAERLENTGWPICEEAASRIAELERIVATFFYHSGDFISCDLCFHETGPIVGLLDVYHLSKEAWAALDCTPAYDSARGYYLIPHNQAGDHARKKPSQEIAEAQ